MVALHTRLARVAAGAALATAGVVAAHLPVGASLPPCEPNAIDDVYQTGVDTPFGVGAPGVSGNDVETCGLPVSWGPVSTGGSFVGQADGSFSFQPDAGFDGDFYTSYYYGAQTVAASAEVHVIIEGDAPPQCVPDLTDDSYTTAQDVALAVAGPGVAANDPDTCGLILSTMTGPTSGALTLNGDGSFVYTPDAGFTGTDQFVYTAATAGPNVTATVTIDVTPDAPEPTGPGAGPTDPEPTTPQPQPTPPPGAQLPATR